MAGIGKNLDPPMFFFSFGQGIEGVMNPHRLLAKCPCVQGDWVTARGYSDSCDISGIWDQAASIDPFCRPLKLGSLGEQKELM